MKVNIVFDIKDQPSGGGNQFLKALKLEFEKKEVYEPEQSKAKIFLFNSHQNIKEVIKLKLKYPDRTFIHRVDGPMRLYNDRADKRDDLVNFLNNYVADATIFQSHWSREKSILHGANRKLSSTIIYNAPDSLLFNRNKPNLKTVRSKIKLIATSWSDNPNKGYEMYSWLDKNIDFNKYEFYFIGRSPVPFQNIVDQGPKTTEEIAKFYKDAHIFITASKNDPCSNSLIEALSSGLPAVVLNSGGHPELVREGGEVFNDQSDIIEKIEKVSSHYEEYLTKIPTFSIEDTSRKYLDFFIKVSEQKVLYRKGEHKRKAILIIKLLTIALRKIIKAI